MSMRRGSIAIALTVAFSAVSCEAPTGEELATRLQAGSRDAADKARDAGRKPAVVVTFLGIQPGMTVVDLIAAGGYYTEVMSLAVGPEGRVYAQNNELVLKMREGANEKAIAARLAGGRLPNVERLDREMSDLGLEPGSVDAAVTALNFHDIYNGRGPVAASAFLGSVYEILAPGGVFGLIDHAGGVGDDTQLHRIDEALVIEAVKRAGFEVEATSDVLHNPGDDRTRMVYEPGMRGQTDRFVLRLRKPADVAAP